MEGKQTGVARGTLVHACQGARSTDELVPGDPIWSFDSASQEWRAMSVRGVAIQSVKANMSHLQVDGTCLKLGCDQLVWRCETCSPAGDEKEANGVANSGCWVQAKNLMYGHRVLTISGPRQVKGNLFREGEAVSVAELEIGELHNYAVGQYGVLVHNRNPALVAGQIHQLVVQGTGAQVAFTLPPVDVDHIFGGFFRAGTQVLEGLHHFTGPYVIQQGVAIIVPNHTVMTTDPAGTIVGRTVNLRIIPALTVSGDAPFSARIELVDPAINGVIAQKNNSTFFPLNWTQPQVVQAIYEAATNYVVAKGHLPVGRGLWADTDAGVRMLLHTIAPAGIPTRISSGYPNGPQPTVTAADSPQ